jgi:hypothetical protein
MENLKRWLVILIALHSLAVGLFLLIAPSWAVRFGGWEGVSPVFFARQAGVFHVVLALGYTVEYVRYRGVALIICAKAVATVFLLTSSALSDVPWVVPFLGVLDGLMGLFVLLAFRARRPGHP